MPTIGNPLDGLDHRADAGAVDGPPKALLAGPAVDDDRGDADLLERPGQRRGGQRRVVPAEPHLDRHRDRRPLDDRRDQRDRRVGLAHQGRAAAALDDLVDRAAHVDVDDRRPEIDHPLGRVAHLGGDVAVDLDRQRPVLRAGLGQLERAARASPGSSGR